MRNHFLLTLVVVLSVAFIWQSARYVEASVKVIEPHALDITDDGNVDARDLMALIGGWGMRDIPTPPPSSHPFEGEYQGTFSGVFSGSVGFSIDAFGNVTGTAVSGSDSINVLGAVSSDGHFYGNEIEDEDIFLAALTGSFSGNTGSGRWMNDEGHSGTWMVTRVP